MIGLVKRAGARMVEFVLPATSAAAACPPDCYCQQQQTSSGWRHRRCCIRGDCTSFCGAWSSGRC